MIILWLIVAGVGAAIDLIIVGCSLTESHDDRRGSGYRRKSAREGLMALALLPLVIMWPIGIFALLGWGVRDMWKTAELPSLESKREQKRARKLQEIEDNKALLASRTALLEHENGIGKS